MATSVVEVKKPPTAFCTSSTSSVFKVGSLSVQVLDLQKSDASSPPTPLLIVTPTVKGQYPILIFNHGFALPNSDYKQLLTHVASHGFIVVAPQVWTLVPLFDYGEIDSVAAVTNWLSSGLPRVLPVNVEGILSKIAISGHSRGGKTAFSLALEPQKTSLKFSALIGVDPVMGFGGHAQIIPPTLTYTPHSLNLNGMPVMVIGTGLGSDFPACAPDGVNHKEVFSECQPPCCYFVAKDYGHMDMIDDNPPDPIGKIGSCVCKKGEGSKDPMRRCVGGLIVAFMKAQLEGETGDLYTIIKNPEIAPITLDPVKSQPNY